MSDAELLHFTDHEAGELTETAIRILKSEFLRRNLDTDIITRIENGSYREEQARLKKIIRTVPDQSNATALMLALNEKRDGNNDETIVYHLMESGMEEEQAWIIINQIKPQGIQRINKARSTMLTSVFILCAGLALKLISPEKSFITFLDIAAPCTMIFGILRFLKGYFEFNKYNTVINNIKKENRS